MAGIRTLCQPILCEFRAQCDSSAVFSRQPEIDAPSVRLVKEHKTRVNLAGEGRCRERINNPLTINHHDLIVLVAENDSSLVGAMRQPACGNLLVGLVNDECANVEKHIDGMFSRLRDGAEDALAVDGSVQF